MKNPTAIQLDKYDINQKIIKVLADLESRTILFSIKQKALLTEDISRKTNIPLSTVYKKLEKLQELTLVKIERIELSDHGRRMKYYKSRISEVEISIRKLEPILILHKN
jgi:predicted transcriptional regulator